MQQFAAFFGGVLLGALVAAACGLDLFGDRLDYRSRWNESQARVTSLETQLDAVRDDRADLVEEFRTTQRHAQSFQRDAETLQGDVDRLETEVEALEGDLTVLRRENAELGRELAEVRQDRSDQEIEIAVLREELQLETERAVARGIEFFSRPRDVHDVELARACLSGDGTLEAKRELVLELRAHSPELLLAIGPPLAHDEVEAELAVDTEEPWFVPAARNFAD